MDPITENKLQQLTAHWQTIATSNERMAGLFKDDQQFHLGIAEQARLCIFQLAQHAFGFDYETAQAVSAGRISLGRAIAQTEAA